MALILMAQWVAFTVGLKREWLQMGLFLVLIFIFYLLFFLQSRSGNTFLSPGLTLTYLPYYTAGYVWTAYIKRSGSRKVTQGVTNVLWCIAAVIFLGLIIIFDLQKTEGLTDIALQMAAGMTGSFVCFYGIYSIKKEQIVKCLAAVGTETLELYIFQYGMHGAFVRLRGLGDTQYSLYCFRGVITVLITFIMMCIVSAIGVYVIKKIPVLDTVLFGHLNRLKK